MEKEKESWVPETIKFNAVQQPIFRKEFRIGSRLASTPNGQRIIGYNTQDYPFDGHIRRLLLAKGVVFSKAMNQLKRLDDLHTILPKSQMTLDSDQLNEISRSFYEDDDAFIATYESLLKNVIGPEIASSGFAFQSTPTIRFHFPNEHGFNWNPRYHTDIMLGHPPQEINLWLPICGAKGSAAMSIASMEDSIALFESLNLDFARFAEGVQYDPEIINQCASISRPAELEYGEILAFDSRCLHATQFNRTDWTRISLDFRIVPIEDYNAMRMTYNGIGRRQMLFLRGHYYASRSSDEL